MHSKVSPHTPQARWYLLRHAQPLIAKGLCYGRLDVPADAALTASAAQAFASMLAQQWAAEHATPHPTSAQRTIHIYSSPLRRCQQLAQSLPSLLHAACPTWQVHTPQTQHNITEIDFGHWEGVAWSQIGMQQWDAWQADFAHYQPGGGEAVAHFVQRVRQAALHTTAQLQQNSSDIVLWVTHAGIMRALHWLQQHGNAPPTQADQWPLDGACACGQWLAMNEQSVQTLHATIASATRDD